ncbi:hypothetical protein M885DRAFT_506818 [Pelagophyceae sp. CCMP2097]|nr:hypothetical protein M885DRAFT_506818 [Pelagophyceae sp. CCMP2097]
MLQRPSMLRRLSETKLRTPWTNKSKGGDAAKEQGAEEPKSTEEPEDDVDDDSDEEEAVMQKDSEASRRELKVQREILAAYEYSLALRQQQRDAGGGDDDQWDDLRAPEPAPTSLYEYFLGASQPEAPAASVPARADDDRSHWINYDIHESLAPNLISPARYAAAQKIVLFVRAFHARKIVFRKRIGGEMSIMEREVGKIKAAWRGFVGRRQFKAERARKSDEEKDWKSYEEFRNVLLLRGYRLFRWSHSKKVLVACTVRVDKTREWLLLQQHRLKSKRYRIKDIHLILRGFASPFMRELAVQQHPEKALSLLLRDSRRNGKEASIDLMFNTAAAAGAPSDSKFVRNTFFKNFCKLQLELESDEAFFFDPDGVYCQVGRSVFDRWEQVTLIHPQWDGEVGEDERRVRLKRKYADASRRQKRGPPGTLSPFPLAAGEKPQVRPQRLYACGDLAATWHSHTVEIDYGPFNAQYPVMRKEAFVLQKVAPVTGGGAPRPIFGRDGLDGRALRPRELLRAEAAPIAYGELKPFFERQLRALYGDIGAAGWRNRETLEFELPEESWDRLCAVADELGGKAEAASSALRRVNAQLEADLHHAAHAAASADVGPGRATLRPGEAARPSDASPARASSMRGPATPPISTVRSSPPSDGALSSRTTPSSPGASVASGVSPRPSGPVDSVASEAKVRRAKKELLKVLWRDKDQKEGKMWRASERSFNTAQKKKITAGKVQLAAAAALRIQEANDEADRRRARPRLDRADSDGSAASSDETGAATDARAASSRAASLDGDAVPREPNTPRAAERARAAVQIVIAVLETARRRKVPLGISVVRSRFANPVTFKDKRGRKVAVTMALSLDDVLPSVLSSISNAWQSDLLNEDDYIVGVDGRFPETHDELLSLLAKSHKPRHIIVARTKEHAVEDGGPPFPI